MMMHPDELKEVCRNVRQDIYRAITRSQCGHMGGSFSAVEILTVLYFSVMNIDPKNPEWDSRDFFINSKGHATAGYYAVLANRGYFDREELVEKFIEVDSCFEEHGSVEVPGVDISTGSLGQGISIAAGTALMAKKSGSSARSYVLIGDGECQEGQIWEAAMFASHYGLDNLCVIIDRNNLQVSGSTEDVIAVEPLDSKWSAFHWEVMEVDGHDLEALYRCLDHSRSLQNGKPVIVIAETVKGKGVSFMEANPGWHSFKPLTKEEEDIAQKELGLS